jgi:hypothetical protein
MKSERRRSGGRLGEGGVKTGGITTASGGGVNGRSEGRRGEG